jgi:hypothetical protein
MYYVHEVNSEIGWIDLSTEIRFVVSSDWDTLTQVKFEVLTAMTMKSTVFLDVAPCSFVDTYPL